MPQRLFANAPAQTTVALAIASGASSVVGGSTANFPVPAAGQQMTLLFLDSGNPLYNANTPLATPFAYAYCTGNNTGTNTLSGLTWGVGGTTAHSFFAGATVAYSILADDINASFPIKFFDFVAGAPTASISITVPSQAYRAILLQGELVTDQGASQSALLQFNGDTAAHYDWVLHQVNATPTITTAAAALATSARFATAALTHGEFALEIPYYANTTLNKGFTTRNSRLDTSFLSETGAGDWRSTAGITSMLLFPGAGNFATGSAVWGYLVP